MTAMTMDTALPPTATQRLLHDLRRNYFASPLGSLVTAVSVGLTLLVLWKVLDWAVLSATFDPAARQPECAANGGACWSVIANRWRLIIFGIYPYEEQWRSALAIVVNSSMSAPAAVAKSACNGVGAISNTLPTRARA